MPQANCGPCYTVPPHQLQGLHSHGHDVDVSLVLLSHNKLLYVRPKSGFHVWEEDNLLSSVRDNQLNLLLARISLVHSSSSQWSLHGIIIMVWMVYPSCTHIYRSHNFHYYHNKKLLSTHHDRACLLYYTMTKSVFFKEHSDKIFFSTLICTKSLCLYSSTVTTYHHCWHMHDHV